MPSPTVKDLYDAMLAVQRAQNMEGNANLNSWFWQFAEAEDFVFADSLGRSFIGKEKVTQHFNYLGASFVCSRPG